MAEKEKVVVAYSGGLDTSVIVKWLQVEKDLEVIAICGNVGQDEEDLSFIEQKALDMGAIASKAVDMREEYADEYLTHAIAANGMYENVYPLLSALSRPLISKHLVDIAHEYGAKYIAHGCTGKGNDQVRFEASIKALDPNIEILAPVRDWDLLTREQEMAWAQEHGVPVPTTKESPYSIDDNLWGRAIECGILEDPWNEPPADIWTMTVDPQDAPDEAEEVVISFKAGKPVALDGKDMKLLDIIASLNQLAGKHGYGRLDIVENRLVGVKSREVYEVPAAATIIEAHKALEMICLDRETQHFKLGVEHKWAEQIYNGLWFSQLTQSLNAFCDETQTYVTGDVRLRFYKGTCTVVGRRSPYSLYDYSLATYGDEDGFNRDSAKGFIELHSLPTTVWAQVQGPKQK
ncbi:MAG: argininosuccinate synthase [Eggerthellaceae bacterium]|nr:argininosuccinate synthase [Eggerthellaceae bacterium]